MNKWKTRGIFEKEKSLRSGSVDDCDFAELKRQILEPADLPSASLRAQTFWQ